MKRRIIHIAAAVIFAALIFSFVSVRSETYALSSSYKYIGKTATKVGDYYYKTNSNYSIVRSKNKGSGYKTVLASAKGKYRHLGYCTNGNYIYTVGFKDSRCYILRYKVSGGKPKVVKKLPRGKYNPIGEYKSWSVCETIGNNILLSCSSFSEWKLWTYKYNIKTKKLKKVMNNCSIAERSGNYVVAVNEYRSDTGPRKATLYKLKSSGKLQKIKVLGKRVGVGGPTFVGKKIYYAIEGEDYVHLYRCNRDGSGKEKLKSFAYTQEYQQILISNYTSTTCDLMFSGDGNYRYTYSTGELKLQDTF